MKKRPTVGITVAVLSGAVAAGAGCYEAPEYIYGDYLSSEPLELYGENTGVHPDTSVLADPNNPFRQDIPVGDMKWEFQSYASEVTAFYSWASVLAIEATGENQFYVAQSLQTVYLNGNAVQEDLDDVLERAIAAYQSVLDNFPDAQSFDPTGTFAFELVTPAYQAILDLDGIPQGDWVLVADPAGNPRAVRQ